MAIICYLLCLIAVVLRPDIYNLYKEVITMFWSLLRLSYTVRNPKCQFPSLDFGII